MRIIVTGGAGFIGHHLVRSLIDEKYEVIVVDNLHRGSFDRPELAGSSCIRADIRYFDELEGLFLPGDIVFHLAAQSNVMGSIDNPSYSLDTNVLGTWNVAKHALQSCVEHLIFTSSREVYGDPPILPVNEDAPLCPRNLYGQTKSAGEKTLSCFRSLGLPVSILRLSNVIGSGDKGRVLPLWLEAISNRNPLILYGGNQEIDFVPVETVVLALLCLIKRGPIDQPINIGSGKTTKLMDLAKRLKKQYHCDYKIYPARGPEVTRFCADTTRMVGVLGISVPTDPLGAVFG